MNRLFVLSLMFSLFFLSEAQELRALKMENNETDLSARVNSRKDINNEFCALVKVEIPLDGLIFEGNIVGDVNRNVNEYEVYMTAGSKTLIVRHPDYYTFTMKFSDFNISSLEAKETYHLVLKADRINNVEIPEEKNKQIQEIEHLIETRAQAEAKARRKVAEDESRRKVEEDKKRKAAQNLVAGAFGNNSETIDLQEIEKLTVVEDDETNKIFTVVDQQPEFPGGEKALMEFIKKNLKYPAFAAENGIQGRVTLSFVVEKDGSVTDIQEMRSPSEDLTKEAKRVVSAMPKWKPGKQRGKPVRVKYVLPVTFRMKSSQDIGVYGKYDLGGRGILGTLPKFTIKISKY